jgi:hypothetical protein
MTVKTLTVNVPEGYELKYQVIKIKTDMKKTGRRESLDQNNEDLTTHQKWLIDNRQHTANYNSTYYQKKKAEKLKALDIYSSVTNQR